MGRSTKRKPDPFIVRAFDSVIMKLEEARKEYVRTALPNTHVESQIRQAKLTIVSLERDWDFVKSN